MKIKWYKLPRKTCIYKTCQEHCQAILTFLDDSKTDDDKETIMIALGLR